MDAARSVRSLWGRIADGWRRLAAFREMEALGEHERVHILSEAGITRNDFNTATRARFASQDLLSAGILAVGADPDAFRSLYGGWNRDMQRVCSLCSARGRCRRDLATADFARRHHLYCPNAASLAQIAASVRRPERPDMPAAAAVPPHPGAAS